ncbi:MULTISPECIES: hypothetical protein [Bacillaceae]|uniref:hypothetical protein n=1 Tax=Bacillaceae TaxID=186817 RepID=UPI0029651A44|nr:hypothetical protein [Bacillus infantis]MDW2876460.1 hypothetical protein [Bacillus infantis]
MKNAPAVYAFLEGLIDYAGLFPPASLPLETAIRNYESYINSSDSWMLGPFIVPVAKLPELQKYQELFTMQRPLALTVVGRKSRSINECLKQLNEDLDYICTYAANCKHWLSVNVIEVPLPPVIPSQEMLKEISGETSKLGMKVFCEVSLQDSDGWRNQLGKSLDSIAAFNALHNEKIGIKLRTGGTSAEMFPAPQQVAFVLASCSLRKLPIKFTAGLHHPIRMYRGEVKTKMHGFLNVFLAGMFAYHLDLDEGKIEEILLDEHEEHFVVNRDAFFWKDLRLPSEEMKDLRKQYLCSFGSCSFVEPRDEFMELSSRQEVI